MAREQFGPFEPRLDVHVSDRACRPRSSKRAWRPCRPHSIVYYLIVYRDGAGRELRAAGVPAPRRGSRERADLLLGRLRDGPGHCRRQPLKPGCAGRGGRRPGAPRAAGRAGRQHPDRARRTLTSRQVDWRQLRRWGISEARVPAGTAVLFREPSRLGSLQVLHHGRARAPGRADRPDRRRCSFSDRGGGGQRRGCVASQAKLRASYDHISDLGGRLIQAQEDERARIARELHDDLGQQIALVAVDLQKAADLGERFARAALGRAHALAKSVHDLSHRLHPAKLRLVGLPDGARQPSARARPPGVTITFTHENVPAACRRM